MYGVDKVDKVWFTCCALHNWLLDVDGLTDKWNGGSPVSNWEGLLGQMDYDRLWESIPNVISQLSINLDPRNYDLSGINRRSSAIKAADGRLYTYFVAFLRYPLGNRR